MYLYLISKLKQTKQDSGRQQQSPSSFTSGWQRDGLSELAELRSVGLATNWSR